MKTKAITATGAARLITARGNRAPRVRDSRSPRLCRVADTLPGDSAPGLPDRNCWSERPGSVASPTVTGDAPAESTQSAPIRTRPGVSLVVGSLLGSTLGIVFAQFLDDLGDGLLAEILGGDAVLYNNRVVISGDVSDLALGGGFVLCLFVGLVSLFAYPTLKGYGIPRLVFLWMLLHTLRQALTQALQLPIGDGGQLGLAYSTLDAPPGLEVAIAGGGGVGLLLIVLSAATAFLSFAPHRRFVGDGRSRLMFVLWVAAIPAAVSAFAAIPYFLPDTQSLVIPTLPLVPLVFLATLAAAPGISAASAPQDEKSTPWPWGLAIFMAVALALYLGVLAGGVSVDPRQWG